MGVPGAARGAEPGLAGSTADALEELAVQAPVRVRVIVKAKVSVYMQV